MAGTEAGGPLWSGRLEGGLHPDVLALTQSLDVDQRLLPYDVAASQAHVRMLGRQGIIPAAEAAQIEDALGQVAIDDGATDEDVHSLIERQLVAMLGDTGRRVHAGRSRNDQVATAFRLWCRAHAYRLQLAVADLQQALLGVAERDGNTVLPAFTHLQRAQPVPLAHHVAAHAWALQRDIQRFAAAQEAANVSPLGAGALAGSSLPLDPVGVAADLGMRTSFANSLDAVSDRDFAADLLYACVLCLVHCSRMGEELILWTSQEFGWAALADDVATGSSMMPQKKNPDVAELARGRSGTAIGRLTGLLATMKGLPLTYNRDLQEDKEGVFAQVDATIGVLRLLQLAYEGLTIDGAKMRAAAADGTTVATDVAEALVRGGMPFRDAHTEVATRIAAGERFDSPTPEEAIAARQGPGMPGRVTEQLAELADLIATTRATSAPAP
ncbi:MAG: argininosuccinate lyase [Thermoleophilia bacterium]